MLGLDLRELGELRRRGDQLADLACPQLLRPGLDVRALGGGHGGLLDRLASLGAGRGNLEAELDPLVGGLEVEPPGDDHAGVEVDLEHQPDVGVDTAWPFSTDALAGVVGVSVGVDRQLLRHLHARQLRNRAGLEVTDHSDASLELAERGGDVLVEREDGVGRSRDLVSIVDHGQLGRRDREAEVLGELDERIQRISEAVREGVVVDDLSGDVALNDSVERGAEVGGIVGPAERLCAGDDVLDLVLVVLPVEHRQCRQERLGLGEAKGGHG